MEKTPIRSDENVTQTKTPKSNRGDIRDIVDKIDEISFMLKAVQTALNVTNERIANNSYCESYDEYVKEEFSILHKLIYLAEDKLYIEIGELDKLSKELENNDKEC